MFKKIKDFDFGKWVKGKRNVRQCLAYGLVIVILIVGYYYRYAPFFYMQKLYSYRIEKSIEVGDYIKAEKLFKNKLFFCKDIFDKENTINAMIRFYTNQRMYNEAEKLYIQKLNEQMFYPVWSCGNFYPELNLINIYNEIAILYINMKDFKNAKKFTDKVLHSIDKVKADKDFIGKTLSRSYLNLGNIKLKEGKNSDAEKYFGQAQEILINYGIYEKDGESAFFDYYVAMMQYYFKKQDYKNAEIYAKKMYATIPNTFLPEPIQLQTTVLNNYISFINSNLGKIYYLGGNYNDAERMFDIVYKINNRYNFNAICSKYYLYNIYKKQNRIQLYKRTFGEFEHDVKKFLILKNIKEYDFEKIIDSCEIN